MLLKLGTEIEPSSSSQKLRQSQAKLIPEIMSIDTISTVQSSNAINWSSVITGTANSTASKTPAVFGTRVDILGWLRGLGKLRFYTSVVVKHIR